MGKVIEIENRELKERKRKVMVGLMAMVMLNEWTEMNLFGVEGVREEIMPAIDETLDKFQTEGTDILEIEDAVNGLREDMLKFMKEQMIEDEE